MLLNEDASTLQVCVFMTGIRFASSGCKMLFQNCNDFNLTLILGETMRGE